MSQMILLVVDNGAEREALSRLLERAGMSVVSACAFITAKDHIHTGFDGVVLSDLHMPGKGGFHLLAHARKIDPELPVILLAGEADRPVAVQAMAKGGGDFLEKPCDPNALLAVLERALKTRRLVLENRRLRGLMQTVDPAARLIIGTSPLVDGLRMRVRRVAQADTDVLIVGPMGSGISKIGEVVHLSGARSKNPFVKRTAADLSPGDLDAALGAAEGGSLFIDELTLLQPQVQLQLVQRLEQGSPIRLIAGSTEDVAAAMAQGQLNAALYYRLDGMAVRIPSLAERPEDIAVLFREYVAQASDQSGQPAPPIPPEVIADLMARDWPGNARALMSAAMRFVMGLGEEQSTSSDQGLSAQMAQIEQSLLRAALRRTGGQASAAAKALKLPRKTFYDKLSRYGIKPGRFRR